MSDAEMTTKEMQTLREVPRPPEHCGTRMKRMSHPSGVSAEVRTLWLCAKDCGYQFMEPLPKKKDGAQA